MDTFTVMEYDNTFVYLYEDRHTFCVLHDGEQLWGQSTIGELVDASAAWINWQSQTPDDIAAFVRHAYDAVQTLGSTSRTVAETALTVEKAAEIVRDVASVVGILCLITGIGSGAAAAMAVVDAAAIKTERIAHSIYQEAAKLNWSAFDLLPAIRDVQVRHTLAPGANQIFSAIQQQLDHLLNIFQQVIHAAV